MTTPRYADVQEAIGPNEDLTVANSWVHLLSQDAHSHQEPFGYSQYPMDGSASTSYSYERWIRLRFNPASGDTVISIRFWTDSGPLPPGWAMYFGIAAEYATPSGTESSIAISPLPTSDPGPDLPNVTGPVDGAENSLYTDWIVLQAVASSSTAGVGPILGFSAEGTLTPINLRFAWTEL